MRVPRGSEKRIVISPKKRLFFIAVRYETVKALVSESKNILLYHQKLGTLFPAHPDRRTKELPTADSIGATSMRNVLMR